MAKDNKPIAQVKPKYSKAMRFPVEVQIPVQVAITAGVDRRLRINGAADALPEPVVLWLQDDRRYAGWFDGVIVKKSDAQPAAAAPKRKIKATVKGETVTDESTGDEAVSDDDVPTPAESE